jgi:hypothetical protein
MQQIYSALWRLNSNDFVKGLCVAVFAAILTGLLQVMQAPGFSFGALDWHQLIQMGFVAGIAYLSKNFATNSNGQVLGMIGH